MTDASYLAVELEQHLHRHFRSKAHELWVDLPIRWAPSRGLVQDRSSRILVPTDSPVIEAKPWTVPFRGTQLTLWNRIASPEGWKPEPTEDRPLWYVSPDGRWMPAWDLYGNCLRLLTFQEERDDSRRDLHGRFLASWSPRRSNGLLEIPAVNEAVAALVGVLANPAQSNRPNDEIGDLLQPPAVVLSHDLDLLRGDDRYTQGGRILRMLRLPNFAGQPRLRTLRAFVGSVLMPHRYHRDAVARIVRLEAEVGARSSFYFLNGTTGRYGARSGPDEIRAARQLIPHEWNLGLHYNYDTHLEPERLLAQRRQLESLLGSPIEGGRAHYLRFESTRSFQLLVEAGLRYDESVGYPDAAGFRAGIAGAFRPRGETGGPLPILAIPLYAMDQTLAAQHGSEAGQVIRQALHHLSQIGGTLTYLLHPERLDSPELADSHHPRYEELLTMARDTGCRFLLPTDFLDAAPAAP